MADTSISDTFKTVGNITNSIGKTLDKVPGLGVVTNPITDVATDIANGISSAFSWMGLGSHVNQIEDHLHLQPITEDEYEYYDRIFDGEQPFITYIETIGRSRKKGNVSNHTGSSRHIEHPFYARFDGLGAHLSNIKEHLDLPNDKPIFDAYYNKERNSEDVQNVIASGIKAGKYKIEGGKYQIDGGKYEIEGSAYRIDGGKYEIEGSGNNDADPDKWLAGSKESKTKLYKQVNKDLEYILKLLIRVKRINHILQTKK